jgi:hypothetical protein
MKTALKEKTSDLKPALIRAFYGFMEMEMEGYNIYVDTPENRFRYTHGSIWIINPITERWMIELKKSGELWYYNGVYYNFLMWFKEERSVFEQLITMWVEDVLKNGVSTTRLNNGAWTLLVEDVLKNGMSTTDHFVDTNNMVM